MNNIPIALTIAGSDSAGGAGIQADLKSFAANRVFGASVLTALTAQNTVEVSAIHNVPADFVSSQLDAVFSDLAVRAVKIGMLSQIAIIEAVAAGLKKHSAENVVLDPVMVTSTGDPLLSDDAIEVLERELLPMALLTTPNLREAARLTNAEIARTEAAMVVQAQILIKKGANAVLIKGGHGEGPECADLLMSDTGREWFRATRIDTKNTHGTGCSLSSAIAANLARGQDLSQSVQNAKTWLTGAIAASGELDIGKGHGPVHHFHELWRN